MFKLLFVLLVICMIIIVLSYTHTASSHKQGVAAPNYVALARQDASAAGISPDLFERQIKQESNFNPKALSAAGAQGIAQFMPTTAQGLGIDPWNAIQALQGAARLMASYFKQYHADYAMALAAYNYGPGNVTATIQRCHAQWRACLPAETQHYIAIITNQSPSD